MSLFKLFELVSNKPELIGQTGYNLYKPLHVSVALNRYRTIQVRNFSLQIASNIGQEFIKKNMRNAFKRGFQTKKKKKQSQGQLHDNLLYSGKTEAWLL